MPKGTGWMDPLHTMGGGKSSGGTGQAATSQAVQPVSTNTGFGSAQYKNGAYNYTSDTDPQAKANLQSAQAGFGGQLQQLQDPSAAMANAQKIAYDAQMPAFQRQQEISQGAATAGLGNRYFSTFGQLTKNVDAQNAAIAAGTMGQNIYNAGNTQLQNMYQNANSAGQLETNAQNDRLAPYTALGTITAQNQPGVTSVNSTNSNNYGTAAGMYNTQQTNQQSGINAGIDSAGKIAAAAAPYVLV